MAPCWSIIRAASGMSSISSVRVLSVFMAPCRCRRGGCWRSLAQNPGRRRRGGRARRWMAQSGPPMAGAPRELAAPGGQVAQAPGYAQPQGGDAAQQVLQVASTRHAVAGDEGILLYEQSPARALTDLRSATT